MKVILEIEVDDNFFDLTLATQMSELRIKIGQGLYKQNSPTLKGNSKESSSESLCNNILRSTGKSYPRTCKHCGLGPCNFFTAQDTLKPLLNETKLFGASSNCSNSIGVA